MIRVLLLILIAIASYFWGFADCLKTYYKRADSGEIFEANGKVYRMVEVQVND